MDPTIRDRLKRRLRSRLVPASCDWMNFGGFCKRVVKTVSKRECSGKRQDSCSSAFELSIVTKSETAKETLDTSLEKDASIAAGRRYPPQPQVRDLQHFVLDSYLRYVSSPVRTVESCNDSDVSCGFPQNTLDRPKPEIVSNQTQTPTGIAHRYARCRRPRVFRRWSAQRLGAARRPTSVDTSVGVFAGVVSRLSLAEIYL